MTSLDRWFNAKGWSAFPFQRETWEAYLRGESGLIHAPTGMGKSYAIWLALIAESFGGEGSGFPPRRAGGVQGSGNGRVESNGEANGKKLVRHDAAPLRAIWVTPMRALANDLLGTLRAPVDFFRLPWTIEVRTGDTAQSLRKKQKERLPTALITTPESLTLLLSYPDAEEKFRTLRCVIVDEWHELLSTKRGVQTELALARLRKWHPELRTWGLSATLSNLEQAAEVLVPRQCAARLGEHRPQRRLISGQSTKAIEIETILPDEIERFPWSGHLGVRLLPQVIEQLERARTSLVFTNTRSQCEIWFRELLHARPDWAAEIALHHGSLDRDLRGYVEDRLRAGSLRCVVCTSSLDLGVDFTPVEQVIQIGSPKGIARLLQRAGRSGHQPGAVSRVVCVPTHAFELVEYAAAREAALHRRIEAREPLEKSLDVLVQHLMTIACAGGFVEQVLFDEVRTTYAYRDLTATEWQWALDFVTHGGYALRAYPQYSRLIKSGGRYVPANPLIERLHRMAIGTITSDHMMQVRFLRGTVLGTIEESFISRLRAGDRFVFAGRTLEFVRTKDMTAYVRKSKQSSGVVPRWDGGRFPLSTQMPTQFAANLLRPGPVSMTIPRCAASSRCSNCNSHGRGCRSRTSCSSNAPRFAKGIKSLCIPSKGEASTKGWRHCSRTAFRESCLARSPSRRTTTGLSCCRTSHSTSMSRVGGNCFRPTICSTIYFHASTQRSSHAGSSAISHASRGSCCRAIRARRKAPANCKRPAVSFTTCFGSTIRRTCFWTKRGVKSWSDSWN